MKKILPVIFILMTLGCTSSPEKKAPTSQELDQKLVEARDALSSQNFQKAAEYAQTVLNHSPYNPRARQLKAISSLAQKKGSEAQSIYHELVINHQNPKEGVRSSEYWLDLAIVSLFLGQPDKGFNYAKNALEVSTLSLKFDPDYKRCFYFPLYYNLGILAAHLEEEEASERYLRKVWEFKRGYLPSKNALLRLYLTSKKIDQVLSLLEEWREEKEFKNLVEIAHHYYLEKKDYNSAARCLLVGLKARPDDFDLNLRLGYTLLHLEGGRAGAIQALEKAKKASSQNPDCLWLLGLAYLKAGQADPSYYYLSYQNFKDLTSLKASKVEVWYYYGLAAHKIGKKAQAQEAYQKAFNINPKFSPARNNYFSLYIEGGAFRQAAHKVEREGDTDDPLALANLASAYYYLGYRDVSNEFFRQALKKAKNDKALTSQIKKLQKGKRP